MVGAMPLPYADGLGTSSRLTSGCEINHVFTLCPIVRFSSYNVGIGSGWIGISDHRPLLVSYAITTDLSFSLQDSPHFVPINVLLTFEYLCPLNRN
eukprot:gene2920-3578_t